MSVDTLELVAVLRRCRVCNQWKRLGNFQRRGHRCYQCFRPMGMVGNHGRVRNLQLTDAGRALLAEMRSA